METSAFQKHCLHSSLVRGWRGEMVNACYILVGPSWLTPLQPMLHTALRGILYQYKLQTGWWPSWELLITLRRKILPPNTAIESRKVSVAQSCPTLCDPMECSPLGCPAHGILQAKMLEWAVIPFSRRSSLLKDRTQVSCTVCSFFIGWATREASRMVLPVLSLGDAAPWPLPSSLLWQLLPPRSDGWLLCHILYRDLVVHLLQRAVYLGLHCITQFCFLFLNFIYLLFLSVLSHCCCAGSSLVVQRGSYSLVAVQGLLPVVASPVA